MIIIVIIIISKNFLTFPLKTLNVSEFLAAEGIKGVEYSGSTGTFNVLSLDDLRVRPGMCV